MITNDINKIINALNDEQVVGLPTETVYGLAANAFSEKAIHQIFNLKKRPFTNPLILHTYSIEEIKKYTKGFEKELLKIAAIFWPGPLTLLLEKNEKISSTITAGSKYVAFRIPKHEQCLAILSKLNYPIAAPSANPYQKISPTTASQVEAYFGKSIPYILDGGNCDCGIESTIIGMQEKQIVIYRQGIISMEALKKVHDNVILNNDQKHKIQTSGMCKIHYAPNTKMLLVDSIDTYLNNHRSENIGVLTFDQKDLSRVAKHYYQKLYEMDKQGYDIIITEKFKEEGIGRALNDKLIRAVSNNEYN